MPKSRPYILAVCSTAASYRVAVGGASALTKSLLPHRRRLPRSSRGCRKAARPPPHSRRAGCTLTAGYRVAVGAAGRQPARSRQVFRQEKSLNSRGVERSETPRTAASTINRFPQGIISPFSILPNDTKLLSHSSPRYPESFIGYFLSSCVYYIHNYEYKQYD